MQLGEALGITGTPGFIIMNMKKPNAATTTFIPGLWTQQLCRAQSKSSRGLKLLSLLMSTAMPVMAATLLQRVIHPSGSYISVIAWPVSYENPVECLPQQKQSSALFFIEPVHNFHQCLTAVPGRALIKQAELLCAVSHSGESITSAFAYAIPGL